MSLAVWSWPLFLAPDGTDHYLTHSLLAAALIQHNHIDFRVHTATCSVQSVMMAKPLTLS